MVGNVGRLRPVPKPMSQTLNEAIALLSFMGSDNKAGKKLLEDMKAAQEHNEKIFTETQAALADLKKREAELEQKRVLLELDTQSFHETRRQNQSALSTNRTALERDKQNFEQRRKSAEEDLQKRINAASGREQAVAELEKTIKARVADLDIRDRKIAELESRLAVKEADLNDRDRRVRAAMGS